MVVSLAGFQQDGWENGLASFCRDCRYRGRNTRHWEYASLVSIVFDADVFVAVENSDAKILTRGHASASREPR